MSPQVAIPAWRWKHQKLAAVEPLLKRVAKERILLLSTDPAHSLADVFGVTIGDRGSRAIGPGEWTDSLGDHIRIQNRASGEVAGIYQPFFNGSGRR